MAYNPSRTFPNVRKSVSPTVDARRLRIEYSRLRQRLTLLYRLDGSEAESKTLWHRIDSIVR